MYKIFLKKIFRDKLNALQNLHTELIDKIQIGLLIIDKETLDIFFTNRCGMELLQLSSSENLGRKIWDLIDSDSIKTVEEMFSQDLLTQKLLRVIHMQRYHEKQNIWVNIYPSQITYHKRPCLLLAIVYYNERERLFEIIRKYC